MTEKDDFWPENPEQKPPGKGFYVALALCVLAIVGVAAVTFLDDLGGGSAQPSTSDPMLTSTTTITTTTTKAQPVDLNATGVPDDRTTTTTAATTTATTTEKDWFFILPSSNVIAKEYSDTLIYSETLGDWRTHNGVDFKADIGSQVKAAADGKVLTVKEDTLWGSVIELEHGDKLISRYCGVQSTVKIGDTVKAGDIIGTVVAIPAEIVKDSHLHFEILANGKYVDPMTLIRGEIRK